MRNKNRTNKGCGQSDAEDALKRLIDQSGERNLYSFYPDWSIKRFKASSASP